MGHPAGMKRDFQALERRRLKAAKLLAQGVAEAEVAREEWTELHPGEAPPSGLVVREPQVRQARAELDAAKADLDVARLSLERTRVSLPFDGVVVSESVDLGQFVTTGRVLATVYGTDQVEVRVPLESRDLSWFEIPDRPGETCPRAEVSAAFAGTTYTWEGRVTRMEAQLDAASRMAHVVVEVARPYAGADGRPPLMPNTFADVRIFGKTLDDVVAIPRHALREGSTVWVVTDGVLRSRPVDVARADREWAYISSGLEDGEQVITSSLDVITDGMKVRIAVAGGNEPQAQTDDGLHESSSVFNISPSDPTSDRYSAIRDQRIARGAA